MKNNFNNACDMMFVLGKVRIPKLKIERDQPKHLEGDKKDSSVEVYIK